MYDIKQKLWKVYICIDLAQIKIVTDTILQRVRL